MTVSRLMMHRVEYTMSASIIDESKIAEVKRSLPYVLEVWKVHNDWHIAIDYETAIRQVPFMMSGAGHRDTWAMKMEHIQMQIWLRIKKESE